MKERNEIVYLKNGADLDKKEWRYKIGCTGFRKNRHKGASGHGVISEGDGIILSFPGDFTTEKAIHMYFHKFKVTYGVMEKGEEIFLDDPSIPTEFMSLGKNKKKLYLRLWKIRDEIFKPSDINYVDEYKFSIKEKVLGRIIKLIGVKKALEDVRSDYKNTVLNNKINNFIITKYNSNRNNKMFNLY